MKHVDMFSGIGGFSIAAERVGIETTQFVEIDQDAQMVLSQKFPGVPIHDDVRTYSPTHRTADVFTVGFPCTDTSVAGTRTGIGGDISSLWFHALRCIAEGQPNFVVIENPPGLIRRGLRAVLGGLRMAGYSWDDPQILSGALLGAPHIRARLFVIAYASSLQWQKQPPIWADNLRALVQAKQADCAWPSFKRSDDGIAVRFPRGLDSVPLDVVTGAPGRIRSRFLFGRSVMPDVAELPMRRVVELAQCIK